MRFLELKEKEVINCKDCRRLGYVADVEFDCETGKILAIIIRDRETIRFVRTDVLRDADD